MNRKRLQAVIEKEWLDMRKNKMVLSMMAVLPLLLVGMILGTVYFMERAPDSEYDPATGDSGMALPPELEALGYKEGTIILLNDQYMFYLLLIPLALPVYVAAYSIIGEHVIAELTTFIDEPVERCVAAEGSIFAALVRRSFVLLCARHELGLGGKQIRLIGHGSPDDMIALRLKVGEKIGVIPKPADHKYAFLWVVNLSLIHI